MTGVPEAWKETVCSFAAANTGASAAVLANGRVAVALDTQYCATIGALCRNYCDHTVTLACLCTRLRKSATSHWDSDAAEEKFQLAAIRTGAFSLWLRRQLP